MLKSSPGFDTRPTLDKIKETLFNILQPDIPGSRFLDLFSGSGSIGIEALSRGASQCVFVENNRKALQCILDNLEHTHLEEDAVVIGKSVLGAISELALRKFAFDIVYIDPPYQAGYEQETLRALAQTGIISPETQVVLETDLRNQLDFIEESDFLIVREKNYKTNKHLFLRLKG